jgi:hypothetical protein
MNRKPIHHVPPQKGRDITQNERRFTAVEAKRFAEIQRLFGHWQKYPEKEEQVYTPEQERFGMRCETIVTDGKGKILSRGRGLPEGVFSHGIPSKLESRPDPVLDVLNKILSEIIKIRELLK